MPEDKKNRPPQPGGSSDVLSASQRSYCMSRIRGRNTRPELQLRRMLWAAGLRYRLNSRLPGRPDLVFPGPKVAVFVDGCFWHGCPEHSNKPRNNPQFWERKIGGNIERDRRVNAELAVQGWKVLRFWEHEIKREPEDVVRKVLSVVKHEPGQKNP